jgi:5-methylcytosine-specific restriction endonuclease McrA
MVQLHFPFTLRLYGHVLHCLSDHNFTGVHLFYRIKDCWKQRDTPHDILVKPLEKGLSFKIGGWCFDTLFDINSEHDGTDKPYFYRLGAEDLLWFLEDVGEAAKLSEHFGKAEALNALVTEVQEIGGLYDSDEEGYWRQLEKAGRHKLIRKFKTFCTDQREPLNQMREAYAYEVADRILHDRQLCRFISQTVMDIGFDGETVDGLRSQWVTRQAWPARIKSIILARDRGKCANCGTDIAQELRGDQHIDHMISLARGGSNDLVNLQLLCSACNLRKSDNSLEVENSVPLYVRRKRTSPKQR